MHMHNTAQIIFQTMLRVYCLYNADNLHFYAGSRLPPDHTVSPDAGSPGRMASGRGSLRKQCFSDGDGQDPVEARAHASAAHDDDAEVLKRDRPGQTPVKIIVPFSPTWQAPGPFRCPSSKALQPPSSAAIAGDNTTDAGLLPAAQDTRPCATEERLHPFVKRIPYPCVAVVYISIKFTYCGAIPDSSAKRVKGSSGFPVRESLHTPQRGSRL